MFVKIAMFFFLIIQISYGYINIYPSFFLKEIKKEGTYETFTLTNRSNRKIRYRIYFEEKSLEHLITEIYPKSIELKPYENGDVKILIKPKESIKPGMYTPILVIKEIGSPIDSKDKKVFSMLKLNLTGYFGNLNVKLVGDIKSSRDIIEMDVRNVGERHGSFLVFLLDKNDEWIFLDSFILKTNESWSKKYDIYDEFKSIKVEEQDEKIYLFQKLE